MTPEDYIRRELAAGRLTTTHIAQLVVAFQRAQGLDVDGKPGPATRAALSVERSPVQALIITDGWVSGGGVRHVEAHSSWSQGTMVPSAIVAHYTATDLGTAESMARRRVSPRTATDRAASWHFTIAKDGAIWQMIPCHRAAMHARLTHEGITLRDAKGHPSPPNYCAIGIELEGRGDHFPDAQVAAAAKLWRALVAQYGIPREQAMVEHSKLDPARRIDPGPVWMRDHAPVVLAHAFP